MSALGRAIVGNNRETLDERIADLERAWADIYARAFKRAGYTRGYHGMIVITVEPDEQDVRRALDEALTERADLDEQARQTRLAEERAADLARLRQGVKR